MVTTSVHYGFGRSVTTISPHDLPLAGMYDYFSHGFGLSGCLLARMAFILYLINLLGARKLHRVALWILLVSQFVTNFLCILLIYIQCPGNPSAIWNPSIKAYCWSPVVQSDYGYFIGSKCSSIPHRSQYWVLVLIVFALNLLAFNTITDLCLAVFPTYIFWNMNLLLRLKISLMVLMGLGLL
jgi:hypothetical protein